ncbi:MAG: hypothetical protein AAF639_38965 [Chloroflexota bacterium]
MNILAKIDNTRYVARCNHGVIHLNWNSGMVHMNPTDLPNAVEFLQEADNFIVPNTYCGDQWNFAMQCPHGSCQTWLYGLGLHMSREDLHMLNLLVDKSQQVLNQWDPTWLQRKPLRNQKYHNICQTVVNGQIHLHINWSQLTFTLSPEEFMAATAFLQHAQTQRHLQTYIDGGPNFLMRDENECNQLWLRNTGVYLSDENLDSFTQLLTQAQEKFEDMEPTNATHQSPMKQPTTQSPLHNLSPFPSTLSKATRQPVYSPGQKRGHHQFSDYLFSEN